MLSANRKPNVHSGCTRDRPRAVFLWATFLRRCSLHHVTGSDRAVKRGGPVEAPPFDLSRFQRQPGRPRADGLKHAAGLILSLW